MENISIPAMFSAKAPAENRPGEVLGIEQLARTASFSFPSHSLFFLSYPPPPNPGLPLPPSFPSKLLFSITKFKFVGIKRPFLFPYNYISFPLFTFPRTTCLIFFSVSIPPMPIPPHISLLYHLFHISPILPGLLALFLDATAMHTGIFA